MDFLDFALILEGAAAAWVLVHTWRKVNGTPGEAETKGEGAPWRAELLAILSEAVATLRRAGFNSGADALKLSALVEKVREGDERATPALAVFCLEKFPEKIAGAYIRKIQSIKF